MSKTSILEKTANPSFFSKQRKLYLAIAAQMLVMGPAFGAPTGGEVVGGVGDIEQDGLQTTITQETDKLAIDWQSFNVAKDERVQFIQPSQSAIALNRIMGMNGSEIHGQIDANGHVILMNPNGVIFSETATINAGGLIASGLSISPDDFLNGDMVFKHLEGTDGSVINAGMINASLGGNVALLGKEVENSGLIMANLGSVNLAAGKEAVLTFDNSGMLGVRVDKAILQEELGDEAAVSNTGEIIAENGQVLLSASKSRDIFSQAVNSGGKAKSVVVHEDGSFTLGGGSSVINTGEIDVSGEQAGQVVVIGENVTHSGSIKADSTSLNVTSIAGSIELHSNTTTELTENAKISAQALNAGSGGDVKVLGKNVGLFDNVKVDASGAGKGGEILVGGDQEGKNELVRNAEFVYLGEQSQINADGLRHGDGGKLITFAKDTIRVYGELTARGGEFGGDGGFIETSGKKGLAVISAPNVSAELGRGGLWLIDPDNIRITDNANDVGDTSPFTPSSNNADLNIDVLKTALQGGDVTITTGTSNSNAAGDIDFQQDLQLDSAPNPLMANTLTLLANDDIFIKGNIKSDDNRPINIVMNANGGGLTDGRIKFDDDVQIDTKGGSLSLNILNADNGAAAESGLVALRDATIETDGGDFSISTFGTVLVGAGTQEVYNHGNTPGVYRDTNDATLRLNGGVFSVSGGVIDMATGSEISVKSEENITLGRIEIQGDNFRRFRIDSDGDILSNSDTAILVDQQSDITLIAQGSAQILLGQSNDRVDFKNVGGNLNLTADSGSVYLDITGNVNLAGFTPGSGPLSLDILSDGKITSSIEDPDLISTNGGDYKIETTFEDNMDYSGITLNLASADGGGDLRIKTAGTLTTGVINIGETDLIDGVGEDGVSNIELVGESVTLSNNAITFGVNDTNRESSHTVNLDIQSESTVDINGFIDNQGEGNDVLNVDISAPGTVTVNNSIWMSNGLFNVKTAGQLDITANGLVGTTGGEFLVGAEVTDMGVRTSVTPIAGAFNNLGNIYTSFENTDAGNINIFAEGNVTLGQIETSKNGNNYIKNWDPTGTRDFELNVESGGTLTIDQPIELNHLVGTGSNTLSFKAAGSISGDVPISTANVGWIYPLPAGPVGNAVNAPNNAALDLLSFGETAANTNFVNNAVIDTFGGDLEILVSGTVNINEDIGTNGGSIKIGSEDTPALRPSSIVFTDFDLVTTAVPVATEPNSGQSGNVSLYSTGNIIGDNVYTFGKDSPDLGTVRGHGGHVTIDAVGEITLGEVSAKGGATNDDGTLTPGVTGNAGVIEIISETDVSLSKVDASGGSVGGLLTGPSANGGIAGSVVISGETIQFSGTDTSVSAKGGTGNNAGVGGGSQTVTITGDVSTAVTTDLKLAGSQVIVAGSVSGINKLDVDAISLARIDGDIAAMSDLSTIDIVDGSVELNHDAALSAVLKVTAASGANDQFSNVDGDTTWDLAVGTVGNVTFVGFEKLVGGTGEDTLQAGDNVNTWTVNAIDSDSTLNQTAVGDTIFTSMEVLKGGSAQDTFNLAKGLVNVTVDGGAAVAGDTLRVFQGSTDNGGDHSDQNYFLINSAVGGVLARNEADTASDDTSVTFSNINNLVGGSNKDVFDFRTQVAMAVDGGEYNVSFGDLAVEFRSDKIIAPDQVNVWSVTAKDTGTLNQDPAIPTSEIRFSNVENLTGNEKKDTFILADGMDVDGVLDGAGQEVGDGTGGTLDNRDVLDVSAWADFSVSRLSFTSPETNPLFISVVDVESIRTATGSLGVLKGAVDENNFWEILGRNTVRLNGVDQANADILIGGDLIDTFFFKAGDGYLESEVDVPGKIDGGAGENILLVGNGADSFDDNTLQGYFYSNSPRTWTMSSANSGVINGLVDIDVPLVGSVPTNKEIVSFSNIQKMLGGGVGDHVDFSNVTTDVTISDDIGGLAAGVDFSVDNIGTLTGNIAHSHAFLGGVNRREWVLSGDYTGTYSADNSDGSDLVLIGITELIGNVGDDIFELNGFLVKSVDGGAGAGVNEVRSGVVAGRENWWQVKTNNAGDLVRATRVGDVLTDDTPALTTRFSSVQTLEGDSVADTFEFSNNARIGTVKGGTGTNTLDVSAYTTAVTVDLAAGNAYTGAAPGTEFVAFEGVTDFQGDVAAGHILSGANQTNTWTLTANNAGNINTTETTFAGFAALVGNEGADIFDLAGFHVASVDGGVGAGLNEIKSGIVGIRENWWQVTTTNSGDLVRATRVGDVLTNDTPALTTTFTNVQTLEGSTTADTFEFTNGVSVGTVRGGTGTNTLDISDYAAAVTVDLAAGNAYTGAAPSASTTVTSFTGLNDFQGSGDKLVGGSSSNSFNITDANTGNVRVNGGASIFSFAGFSDLIGGAGTDSFTFSGNGALDGKVDGITGATDKITGKNIETRWTVTSLNSGNLVQVNRNGGGTETGTTTISEFSNIQELIGGADNDEFVFDDLARVASVTAGGGTTNTLDVSAYSAQVTVDLSGGSAYTGTAPASTTVTTFTGLNDYQGSGDKLVGGTANAFNVTGTDTGTVSVNGGAAQDFSGFQDLLGGSGVDSFLFGANGILTGELDGNGGVSDSITSQHIGVDWSITDVDKGSLALKSGATITSFDNIQKLTGSTGNDTFTINAGAGVALVEGGAASGVDEIRIADGTLDGGSTDSRNNNIWTLTGENTGQVDITRASASTSIGISFVGVESLIGGSVADTFLLTNNSVVPTTIGQIVKIDGGAVGGGNTISQLRSIGTTWEITDETNPSPYTKVEVSESSNGAVLVADAKNIGRLQGGAGDDIFDYSFDALALVIALGGGQSTPTGDVVDLMDVDSNITLNLGNTTFEHIETVKGNATDTRSATLGVVSTGETIWNVIAQNAGDVTSAGQTTNFEGFDSLVGSSGVDRFSFASTVFTSPMEVDGAGSDDFLIGVNSEAIWEINQTNEGTLNVAGAKVLDFENIEGLVGGNAKDTFNINGGSVLSIDGGSVLAGDTRFDEIVQTQNITSEWDIETAGILGAEYTSVRLVSGSVESVADAKNISVLLGSDSNQDNFSVNAEFEGSIDGRNGNDIFVINSGVLNGVFGGNGNDSITLNTDALGVVDGGVNFDDFFIGDNQTGEVIGGFGNDQFFITAEDISVTIDASNAGANDDELHAFNVDNLWRITGDITASGENYQGELGQVGGDGNLTGNKITFRGVEALFGSAAEDVFDFVTNQITTALIIHGDSSDPTQSASDRVIGFDVAASANGTTENVTWNVTGKNAGTVISQEAGSAAATFDGVENLQGKAGIDLFVLAKNGSSVHQVDGVIDGGGPLADPADLSKGDRLNLDANSGGVGNKLIVSYSAPETPPVDKLINISSIENVVGTNYTVSVPNNTDNYWAFNGKNTVTVLYGDAGQFGSGAFTDASGFVGGHQKDEFTFKSDGYFDNRDAVIDGGLGDNSIVFDNGLAHQITIQSGAVSASSAGDPDIAIDGSIYVIGSDPDNNTIYDDILSANNIFGNENGFFLANFKNFTLIQGGGEKERFVVRSAFRGTLEGLGGNDDFVLDANDFAATFSGGDGVDSITGSGNDSVWVLDTTSTLVSGLEETAIEDKRITFLDIETIQGGNEADEFTINSVLTETLNGGNGDDTFILNVDAGVDVNGQNNDDTFTILASQTGDLIGEGGDDTYDILAPVRANLIGGSGPDTINATIPSVADATVHLTNYWLFTGNYQGTLAVDKATAESVDPAALQVTYANIDIANGGNSADVFDLSAINRGLNLALNGNDGQDSLIGLATSESSHWRVTDNNTGFITRESEVGDIDRHIGFSSIENLQGNGGSDYFALLGNGVDANYGVSGLIDGGDPETLVGGDTLDVSAYVGSFTISYNDPAPDDNKVNIVNIESIVTAPDHQGIIEARNINNTWTITGQDSGSLTEDDNGVIKTTTFTGFKGITGGNKQDIFVFESGGFFSPGSIVDGSGYEADEPNEIQISDTNSDDHNFLISGTGAGTLSRKQGDTLTFKAGFANIQKVSSGAGDDVVQVQGNFAGVFDGGAGDDIFDIDFTQSVTTTLTGNSGNDTFNLNQDAGIAVLGGDDNDIFNIFQSQTGLLSGEFGDDTFNVRVAGLKAAINGGLDDDTPGSEQDYTDTIQGPALASAWQLTGNTAGKLAATKEILDSTDPSTAIVTFEQIDTIRGGAESDDFVISSLFDGYIFGQNGADTFQLDAGVAGGISGGNQNDTFILNADAVGDIHGDAQYDVFDIFASQTGKLFGDAGRDTFTLKEENIIADIDAGSSGDDDDTLQAGNFLNTIVTDKAAGGVLTNGISGRVTFDGFELIKGGSEKDVITVTAGADFDGQINGMDGGDDFFINAQVRGQAIAAITNDIAGGVIGGAGDDSFTITAEVGANVLGQEGSDTFTITASQSVGSQILGGLDSDTFIVDANTYVLDLVGGDDTGTEENPVIDSLFVNNNEENFWSLIESQKFYVAASENAANKTEFEGIEVLSAGDQKDIFDIQTAFVGSILGNEGDDEFRFTNTGSVASISGGDDDDTVDYSGRNGAVQIELQGSGELQGIAEVETFVGNKDINSQLTVLDGLSNPEDLLDIANNNVWTITGENTGEITFNRSGADAKSINFVDFARLVGGEIADTFVMSEGIASATIGSIVHIDGGATSTNTLVQARQIESNWLVTESNDISATTVQLEQVATPDNVILVDNSVNVSSLVGGEGLDTFVFSGTNGDGFTVDGGDGVAITDEVRFANQVNDLTVQVDASGNAGAISGVESFVGDASVNSLLVAVDGTLNVGVNNNAWLINQENGGELTLSRAGTMPATDIQTTLSFSGFNQVQGGSVDDVFELASVAGTSQGSIESIQAGAGLNTLSLLQDAAADWTLQGESADPTQPQSFVNVQKTSDNLNIVGSAFDIDVLNGSAEKDTFVVNGTTTVSVVNGGDELDVLSTETFSQDLSINLVNGESNIGVVGDADKALTFTSIEILNANQTTNNTLTGLNATATWSLTANKSGNIDYDAPLADFSFTHFENLMGGSADDTFQLNGFALTDIKAGMGENSLYAGAPVESGLENLWDITGARQGTVKQVSRGNDGAIENESSAQATAFADIDNVFGGDAVDSFVFAEAGRLKSVNAAGESDSISLSNQAHAITLVESTAPDETQGNILSGAVAILEQFFGVETIRGGEVSDIFYLQGDSGVTFVDGGPNPSGDNTIKDSIDTTGYSNDILVDLKAETIDIGGGLAFSSIEKFDANSATVNTLQGRDGSAEWILSADRSGTVAYAADNLIFDFTQFDSLIGGTLDSSNDVFKLNGFAMSDIAGGAGTNTLEAGDKFFSDTITAYENLWLVDGLGQGNVDRISRDVNGNVIAMGNTQSTRFNGITNITGGTVIDRFELLSSAARISGVIDGGAGNADALSILDGSNQWTFALDAEGNLSGTVADRLMPDVHTQFANLEIFEGSGADSLFGSNHALTWTFSDIGNGNITQSTDASQVLAFAGFSAFVGGTEQDKFIVPDTNFITEYIDGGASGELDEVTISQAADVSVLLSRAEGSAVVVDQLNIANINRVQAVEGFRNVLKGAGVVDSGYIWNIDDVNTGTVAPISSTPNPEAVTRFVHFTDLQGGSKNDTFAVEALGSVATVTGNGGSDTLDLALVTRDLDIAIGADNVNGISVNSIETLIGNNTGAAGSPYQATLRTDAGNNTWLLDGINDGRFNRVAVPGQPATNIRFLDFNHIVGGNGVDAFSANGDAMVTGMLIGGGGADTFTYTDTQKTNTIALVSEPTLNTVGYKTLRGTDTGVADAFVLSAIETVVGTGAVSTLIGSTGDNTWQMDGANAGDVSFGAESVRFSGVHNLKGRQGIDQFIFDQNDTLGGWLSGGFGNDSATFDPSSAVASVGFADSNEATSLLTGVLANVRDDIELVSAQNEKTFTLLANTQIDDRWELDSPDGGKFNAVSFTGFDNLSADAGDDSFVLLAGGALSGLMDGGEGVNTLIAGSYDKNLSVSLGLSAVADIQIERIDTVTANAMMTNTFIGRLNTQNAFEITGANRGAVNTDTAFVNFGNLTGGVVDDTFAFIGEGALSGLVDGLTHEGGDTVDYSLVERALNVPVDGSGGIRRIENLIGNQQLNLVGANVDNEWILDKSVNEGRVEFDGQILAFSKVNNLVGGNQRDTFTLNGGQIDGTISGGDGIDTLEYVVLEDGVAEARTTQFIGGAGDDVINIRGGSTDFEGRYQALPVGAAETSATDRVQFTKLTGDDTAAQIVEYSDVATINQTAASNQFIVSGVGPEKNETIELGTSLFTVQDHVGVTYDGATTNLIVDVDGGDAINIADNVNVPNRLELRNGSVNASNPDAIVTVPQLVFTKTKSVGTVDSPIKTDVNSLSVTDLETALYLQEANTLSLGAFSTAGDINLQVLVGDVVQSQVAETSGVLNITANDGNILLDRQNLISSKLGLTTATTADITNASAVDLADVNVGELKVTSAQSISDSGLIVVAGQTTLDSQADIILDTPTNDFANLAVTNAVNVDVTDQNTIGINAMNASGTVNVRAQNVALSGLLNADIFNVLAANEITQAIGSELSSVNATSLTGERIVIDGSIQGSVTVDTSSRAGDTIINGVVKSSGGTNITGNNIRLNREIVTDGNLKIAATGAVTQLDSVRTGGVYQIVGTAQSVDLSEVQAGSIDITSLGAVRQTGDIFATGEIVLSAGSYASGSENTITSDTGSVSIDTSSDLNSGIIGASQNIDLQSSAGALTVSGDLNAIEGNVTLFGETALTINSPVTGQAGVGFTTNGRATINNVVRALTGNVSGDVLGSDLDMTNVGEIITNEGDILLTVNGDVNVNKLHAIDELGTDDVTVNVVSTTGAILDADGDDLDETPNIRGTRFNGSAVTGIGTADDAIETDVYSVNLVNSIGSVNIANTKTLLVNKLFTQGDIIVSSVGDFYVRAGGINAFYDPNVPLSGDVVGDGVVRIDIEDGSFVTFGDISESEPNIAGRTVSIVAQQGYFGGPGTPPFIYAIDEISILAQTSWNRPFYSFRRPKNVSDTSATQTNLNEIGAGEQIVQVETLEQVDPAIFTSVNNYFYQDISILMPEDQRFDEIEEEADGDES